MKSRMQERCKENPQQCEEMKAKMKERHEQCKADPQKCRDEMKARREEWCKANPQQCEEMKAKIAGAPRAVQGRPAEMPR